jgi:hypothetical protein
VYAGDIPVALWQSSQDPSADACGDATSTVGLWKVNPEPGQVLCVRTTAGRIAALQVAQVEYGGVLFNVIVWQG